MQNKYGIEKMSGNFSSVFGLRKNNCIAIKTLHAKWNNYARNILDTRKIGNKSAFRYNQDWRQTRVIIKTTLL